MISFWTFAFFLTVSGLFALLSLLRHSVTRIGALAVSFVYFMVVGAVYYQYGSGQELVKHEQEEQAIQKSLTQLKSPEELIEKMEQRLVQSPNDKQGWFLLGKLQYALAKFDTAEASFERALEIDPKDKVVQLRYANASFFNHQRRLTPVAKTLLQGVIKRNPSDAQAHSLLAMDAFAHHNYRQAISHWRQVLPNVAPNSEDASAINAAINRARDHIRNNKHTTNSPHINVRVSIPISLRRSLAPNTPVFIFAKTSAAATAPVAVTTTTIAKLSKPIALGDADALEATVLLSHQQEVTVHARVSISGTSEAKAGDWEGTIGPVKLHAQPKLVKVRINHKIA